MEDLAVGFFRGLFALVHALARLAVDFFWHAVGETVAELVLRIFSAIVKALVLLLRLLLTPIEWLYRIVFDRVARRVASPALAHLCTFALLISSGFLVGAGASVVYHQAPIMASTAQLEQTQ